MYRKEKGSWYGEMGNCYIYVRGSVWLVTVTRNYHLAIHLWRAVLWLETYTAWDGGWGESPISVEKRFVLCHLVPPIPTRWALDALISYYDKETPVIRKGIFIFASPTLIIYKWKNILLEQDLPGGLYSLSYYAHIYPLLYFGSLMQKI